MEERGVRLTASSAATARRYSSADLGRTLRSILLSPRNGFVAALASTEKRLAAGTRPAEGLTTYVLTGVGGAAAMLLWLKLGGLVGTRDVAGAEFRWSYLVAALVGAAIVTIAVQALWALTTAIALKIGGSATKARELRLVWGASAFPQVLAFLVLLPLDLLIVGADTFTTVRLTDPLATGWAAISIALSVSLGVWSLYLFARGVQVAAGAGWGASAAGLALAVACSIAMLLALLLVTRPFAVAS